MKIILQSLAALAAGGFCFATVAAGPPKIVMEEFMVPSKDPGIRLYLRNKHARGAKKFSGDKILLFVHGATYPAETSFDLRLNGVSWMDYIAMEQPPEQNAPIVRTETAVKDVGAAVDFIRERRGLARINLMGWSWGTSIMGWYTAQNNAKVAKLVLYAPGWIRSTASLTDTGGPLGAYRQVSMTAAKDRWLKGVAEDKKAELIPAGWFEAWAEATLASDPAAAKKNPPMIRAPNGVQQDGREYWSAGKPLYDPAEIRVPTFLAHAEWDQDLPSYMLHAYFAKLVNVPYKRYVEIGEGTHTVIMEKNRMQLFQAVQQFLDEDFKPGR